MKIQIHLIVVIASVLASGLVQAESFTDTAEVLGVEPIVRHVRVSNPRRECWEEPVVHSSTRSRKHGSGDVLAGGIIGGIIGHEIGRRVNKGRNKHNATLAGAILGAAIGHDGSHSKSTTSQQMGYQEKCRSYTDFHEEERIDGYKVTYRYQGGTYTTRMSYDPGRRLSVRVRLSPITH